MKPYADLASPRYTCEWYTPPHIFEALGLEFDLDPCSPAGGLHWIPAKRFYSLADNGLTQAWEGRVFMNPPYHRKVISAWMQRLVEHGNGVALVLNRTDTQWFQEYAWSAYCLCFIHKRVVYIPGEGQKSSQAGCGSVLLGFGPICAEAVANCGLGTIAKAVRRNLTWQGPASHRRKADQESLLEVANG